MITTRSARNRLLSLTALRWLPVGITVGVFVLLPLERGLTVAQIGSILAVQGFVVLGLELPFGAFSDRIGRRPLLIFGGLVAAASAVLMLSAHSYAVFAIALLLQGIFRAADSGALESWFVDTVHKANPHAKVAKPLADAGTVLGFSIAGGSLLGGLLITWHPLRQWSAFTMPMLVSIALYLCYTTLVLLMVPKERVAASSPEGHTSAALHALRTTPTAIVQGFRLLSRSSVLFGLILVEVFWSVAMIAFETLTPLHLEEITGSEQSAAAIFSPASAAAWAIFALGSLLAGWASRTTSVTWLAILSRLLNGAFVVAMGLASGVVGVLVAFGLVYLTHGSAGPMHAALLHRQADSSTRATILALNSMIAGGAYSIGLLLLTALADSSSTGLATVVAGAFSLLGALCYIPALRQERQQKSATAPAEKLLADVTPQEDS